MIENKGLEYPTVPYHERKSLNIEMNATQFAHTGLFSSLLSKSPPCHGWPALVPPPFRPHALLDPIPYPLHHLTISPPTLHAHVGVPLLDLGAADPTTPAAHRGGDVFPPPAHVDAHYVPEQFGWGLPLVAAELPRLARSKDRHDPAPVVRLELLRRVDEDEPQRSRGVNGWQ